MGTKTAALAGLRLEKEESSLTSGCQLGGWANRVLSAAGKRCAGGTAGISWSMRQIGTLRGSKKVGLDTGSIYTRQMRPDIYNSLAYLNHLVSRYYYDELLPV